MTLRIFAEVVGTAVRRDGIRIPVGHHLTRDITWSPAALPEEGDHLHLKGIDGVVYVREVVLVGGAATIVGAVYDVEET